MCQSVNVTPWITGVKHRDSKKAKKGLMIERRKARRDKRVLQAAVARG